MGNDEVQLLIQARSNIKKVMKSMRPGDMSTVKMEHRAFYDELNDIQKEIKIVVNTNSNLLVKL